MFAKQIPAYIFVFTMYDFCKQLICFTFFVVFAVFDIAADYQCDSSFSYELPVLNATATELFKAIPKGVERFEELKKVFRALLLFGHIDESMVAEDAVLREFIGGGSYEY